MGNLIGEPLAVPKMVAPDPWILFDPAYPAATQSSLPRNKPTWAGYDRNEFLNVMKGRGFYFGVNGATATYSANAGPEGLTTAHRFVFAGGAGTGLAQISSVRFQPGTYTFAADIRTTPAASSPQTFSFGTNATNATVTATTSWQTFTQTFTVAATGNTTFYIAIKDASSNPYDILVDNVRVVGGSSSTPEFPQDGHLRFGSSQAMSSNQTFPSNRMSPVEGWLRLPAAKTLTEFTALFAIRQTANAGGSSAVLSAAETFTALALGLNNSTTNSGVRARFSGATIDSPYLNMLNRGWFVLGCRFRNGTQEIFRDCSLLARSTDSWSGVTTRGFQLFAYNVSESVSDAGVAGQVGPLAMYDRYLTENECAIAQRDLMRRLAAGGNPAGTPTPAYLASGDSITQDAVSYANKVLSNNSTSVSGGVFATNGIDIGTLITNLQYQLPWMRASANVGGRTVFSVLTGANSSTLISDPTGFYNQLVGLYRQVRGSGGKVLAITCVPKYTSGFNAARGTVNTLLRNNPQEYDALADLDTVAAGQDSAVTVGSTAATTYYTDGVHPNATAHAQYESVVKSAYDAVLATI